MLILIYLIVGRVKLPFYIISDAFIKLFSFVMNYEAMNYEAIKVAQLNVIFTFFLVMIIPELTGRISLKCKMTKAR